MNWATAVVIIVAMMVIGSMLAGRSKSPQGPEPASDDGSARREAQLQREVEDLRERIKVLERIATDGREANRLAADIERLRDE